MDKFITKMVMLIDIRAVNKRLNTDGRDFRSYVRTFGNSNGLAPLQREISPRCCLVCENYADQKRRQ